MIEVLPHRPPDLPRALQPDLLHVPAFEAETVRLFRVDAAAVVDFAWLFPEGKPVAGGPQVGLHAARLAHALGVGAVDPDHVTLIRLADLSEQGLEDYLTEGQGIAPQSLFADLAMLAGLSGHVLVATSPAFGGAAVTLQPQAGLAALGVWPRAGASPPHLMRPAGDPPRHADIPKPARASIPHPVLTPVFPSVLHWVALVLVAIFGGVVLWYLR